MKRRVVTYAFNADNRTVTFSEYDTIELAGVLMVINVTRGADMYDFADDALGGSVKGNVLTLELDTSTMLDTDELMIWYDDGAYPITVADLRSSPLDVRICPDAECVDDIPPVTLIDTDLHGSQPAGLSMPVALPPEQIRDLQTPLQWFQAPLVNTIVAYQDCLQYRTVAIQIITSSGTAAGVITFETSNDGAVWSTLTMLDQASTSAVGVTSVTLESGVSRFFMAPVMFRYFRARVSTAVTGIGVGILATYRMAPMSFATCVDNIAQWGGGTAVTAGVAGMVAVGGNIAAGTAPTAYPVPTGGVDETYPSPLTRRIVTDGYGYLATVGPSYGKAANTMPIRTDLIDSGAVDSLPAVLRDILTETRKISNYFRQLPDIFNTAYAKFDEE